jgi:hypothetical protein
MPVQNRIKIIKCDSYEDVENKVNDFLAFDKDIAHLIHIDYRLEFNFVIIEYYVVIENDREEYNNNKKSSLDDLMFSGWWKLYFPFLSPYCNNYLS